MESEDNNYSRIINILRQSRPELRAIHELENEVITRIEKHNRRSWISNTADLFFGWTYIRWVRRSLIVCSLLLVSFFVWQQKMILNEMHLLRTQIMIQNRETTYDPSVILEKKLMIYRITDQNSALQIREIQQVIDSINSMQIKYRNIIDLIEEDPVLKKRIEQKMKEINRIKTKI